LKPKLKPHVHYAPTADGVFIRSWTHEFVLKGNNMYDWLERLVPFLNGEQTLEQLTARLSAAQRRFIEHLVQELVQRSVVVDASEDMAVPLAPEELALYKQTVLFLEDQTNEGRQRFQTFRRLRVALPGRGISHKAFVRSLFKMGLRYPILAAEPDSGVQSIIDDWRRKDATLQPVWLRGGAERVPLPEAQPDLVVWVSDDYNHGDVMEWIDRCSREQIPLLVASSLFRDGVIGPIMDEKSKAGWLCLLDRWVGPDAAAEETFPLSFRMMIGNIAAMEVLKYVCRLPESGVRDQVVTLEPLQLKTDRRRLHPSPLRTGETDTPQEALALFRMREEEEPADIFLERIQASVDERIGIITSLYPGELKQIPLSHIRAVVRAPGGIAPPDKVIGWGESQTEAMERTVRTALVSYAKSVDRHLHGPDSPENDGVWVGGRTFAEWLGRGILEALAEESLRNGARIRRLDVRSIPWRAPAAYLKMLQLRFGIEVRLTERELPVRCGACVTVWSGGDKLAETAGRTQEEALLLALQQAVSRLQLGLPLPPGTVGTNQFGEDRSSEGAWREETKGILAWKDWTANAKSLLADGGYLVIPVPWLRDRAIYDYGMLVGQVGIRQADRGGQA
jgi:hypothetical protein